MIVKATGSRFVGFVKFVGLNFRFQNKRPFNRLFSVTTRACLCLFLLASIPAFPESLQIRPSADTTLLESAPDFNMGAEWHVASGTTGTMGLVTRNRALIRFSLDALPPQAVIQSVTFTLHVTGLPGRDGGGGPISSVFGLHRVLKSWGEGNKLGFRGEFATAGEATWNHRSAPSPDVPLGEPWSQPGMAPGPDFATQPSASQLIAGTNRYVFPSSSALIADVQLWRTNPAANAGWLLLSDAETRQKTARRFGSREDAKYPPILTIEYSPPSPLRIEQITLSDKTIQFQFTAQSSAAYSVEWSRQLPPSWITLTNIPIASTNRIMTISDPIADSQRFYRLVRLE